MNRYAIWVVVALSCLCGADAETDADILHLQVLDAHLSSNAVSGADQATYLWWEPHVSLSEKNRMFEREHRLPDGSVVRMLVKRLEDEVVKNTSQDTNTVPLILDGLLRSLPPFSPLMENALFLPSNRHVHAVMEACVLWEARADGGVAFMKSLLANMSPERRAACYAELGKRMGAARQPLYGWRNGHTSPIFASFLDTAVEFDPDTGCLMALDQALTKPGIIWKDSQSRKRLAFNHRDSGGEPGAYFKKLSATLGPPSPPTLEDIKQRLFLDWIEGMEDAPDLDAVFEFLQQRANRKFAFAFGLTKRETVHLLESKLMELAYAGQSTPGDKDLMESLLATIWRSRDADSAGILLELIGKPGNHDLAQSIHSYLKVAGIDGFMPMIRRVKKEYPQMDAYWFSSNCWKLAAEYAGQAEAKSETQREIIGFLRNEVIGMADPYLSEPLDRSLLACDPAWQTSAERESLANRISKLPDTLANNVRYFTGVLKQFEKPVEPANKKLPDRQKKDRQKNERAR